MAWASCSRTPPSTRPAVGQADLAGADDPVAAADDGRVRADRGRHGAQRYPRRPHRGSALVQPHRARRRRRTPRRTPARRGRRRPSTSTEIGGVSTARSTPKERIVRSWTTPSPSTVMDSDVTHDAAWCAAPMQYDRSATSSNGSPASTRTAMPSSVQPRPGGPAAAGWVIGPTQAPASAGPGWRAGRSPPPTPRPGPWSTWAVRRRRPPPPRARAPRRGWRRRCRRCGRRGRRRSRRRAGRQPAAGAWRRAGPCPPGCGGRVPPCRARRRGRGRLRGRGVGLGAEGPAVAGRARRHPARLAPGRIGLEVGGLDPGRLQGERPVAVGHGDRRRGCRPWCGGPAPSRRPRERQRRTRRASSGPPDRAPRPRRRPGRCRRRSRRPRGRPRGRAAGGRGPRAVARAAAASRSRRGVLVAVRVPRVRGSSASRCSGTGGRAAPAPPSRALRPGPWPAGPTGARRCRACRTRTGSLRWRTARPPRSPASSRRSGVVISRPRTRRTGVTQATRGWPSTSTVQQPHWPCGEQPSFADRSPSCSRRTSSSDAVGSATSTSRPFTRRSAAGRWTVLRDRGRPWGHTTVGPHARPPRRPPVPTPRARCAQPAWLPRRRRCGRPAGGLRRRRRVGRHAAGEGSGTSAPGDAEVVGGLSVVRFFGPYYRAGQPARVPSASPTTRACCRPTSPRPSSAVTVRSADRRRDRIRPERTAVHRGPAPAVLRLRVHAGVRRLLRPGLRHRRRRGRHPGPDRGGRRRDGIGHGRTGRSDAGARHPDRRTTPAG